MTVFDRYREPVWKTRLLAGTASTSLRPCRTVMETGFSQEMLLALEIERRYTKNEILRMYVNQVYMGHGRYGLEAASQFYFGKHAERDLTLPEAALLAGILQRPESLTPLRNPEGARRRMAHVLRRMVETGAIDSETADRAAEAPLEIAAHRDTAGLAPYFVEAMRRWLQDRYGDEKLYQGGLKVYAPMNLELQRTAEEAVGKGLRDLDKLQGYRSTFDELRSSGHAAVSAITMDLLALERLRSPFCLYPNRVSNLLIYNVYSFNIVQF